MKIYHLFTTICILCIGSIECTANTDSISTNKYAETTFHYAHHKPVILKCEQGDAFELSIRKYRTKHAFKIIPCGFKYINFNKLSFVFSDGQAVTIENKTPTNGITCYFGDIWENEELWQWLENKDLKSLVINDVNEIYLKDKSLIKSILSTLEDKRL